MDNKAAACEEVSQELARESLIGISYCIPGKVPNSEIVPQAVNVEERLPVMNGDGAEKQLPGRFTISWPVLLESLQFFCVNYTVKMLDIDATQGSGPAAQHPCRKATFLLATIVALSLKNQPGAEEVVKDSTSCSRWKEDEKEW
ncbi:hypothetical protein NC651_008497 [Populus alba x Populus x berolinensis]|nr:hypothetical protein NC651_008497 [Populus alba x Populus x berolinensis]